MLFCCNQAKLEMLLAGLGVRSKTNKLQLELTEPVGPQSSMLTTIRPTIHKTKKMKPPTMTMAGNRRRWEMSHSRPPMKTMVRLATVMK